MRAEDVSDYFLELPEVGVFRYGQRTFGDRTDIRREVLRTLRELGDEDAELNAYATISATHRLMCVDAPAGWESIDKLKLSKKVDKQIYQLFEMVRAKEDEFREDTETGVPSPG